MKTKSTSLWFPQAARLLLITCATLASGLLLLGTAAAQSAGNSSLVTGNGSSWNNSSGLLVGNNSCDTLTFHNSYDGETHIVGGNLVINTTLTINTLSLDADSTLEVDGTLTVKQISCDAPNAKMILCPNAVIDLEGSTLTASSLTLADGTEIINGTYSFNDGDNTLSPVPADLLDTIPSYKLSNGAKLIHGTLIIDSTKADAVHLVESNEDGNESIKHFGTLMTSNIEGPGSMVSGTSPDSFRFNINQGNN